MNIKYINSKWLYAIIISISLLSCAKKTNSKEPSDSLSFIIDSVAINQEDIFPPIPEDSIIESDYEEYFKLDNYLTTRQVPEKQMQLINSSCVILVFPTSEQSQQSMNSMSEDDYNAVLDDNMYYQSNATAMVESLHVKIVTANKRFLKMVGPQIWVLDIRKKNLPTWNMIFFSVNKNPEIVSVVDLTENKIVEYFDLGSESEEE